MGAIAISIVVHLLFVILIVAAFVVLWMDIQRQHRLSFRPKEYKRYVSNNRV